LAAVSSAPILLSSFIDPVFSSTGSLPAPHVAVEVVLKFIFRKPATRMKSVVIEPDPLIWIVASELDVPGV